MKKRITFSLASLLACAAIPALTACPSKKEVVTFWHTMGQDKQALVDRIIGEFNKVYPDIEIEHSAQGDYTGLHEKLKSAIPAGTMPTMAFCYPDHVADYMSSNAVINIDTYLARDDLKFTAEEGAQSDFVESYWKEGQAYQTTGTYSVPFAKSTEVMFYNKTFFDKYSSKISVPTTWAEMWETCRIIKEEIMPLEPGIEFPMGYDSDSNLFITLCEQRGIPYITNENVNSAEDHIKFNNADAKALINDLVQKERAGYFATKNCLANNAYTSTYFTEEKTVMSIGSTGGTSYQTSSNFEVAVAPAPVTSNTGSGNKIISQGPSICFFKKGSAEIKEGAWKFYKFLTKAFNTAAYATMSGYEPVRTSAKSLPEYQTYLQGTSLQAKVSKVTATIDGDRFIYSPVFVGSAKAREEVGTILSLVYSNLKTLDDAFAQAYRNTVNATRK